MTGYWCIQSSFKCTHIDQTDCYNPSANNVINIWLALITRAWLVFWSVIENFSYWSIGDRVVYGIIWTVTLLRTKLLIHRGLIAEVQLLGLALQRDRMFYRSIDFLCGITSRDWAFIDSVVKAVDYSRQAAIALSSHSLILRISAFHILCHQGSLSEITWLRTFRILQNVSEGHVTFRVCIPISALHLSQFC